MVLFPDVFNIGDFGSLKNEIVTEDQDKFSARWKNVSAMESLSSKASALQLAKAMGAQVTSHLHNSVTHILTELKDINMLKWNHFVSDEVYCNSQRGSFINSRLLQLEKSYDINITLISPSWIREQW